MISFDTHIDIDEGLQDLEVYVTYDEDSDQIETVNLYVDGWHTVDITTLIYKSDSKVLSDLLDQAYRVYQQ